MNLKLANATAAFIAACPDLPPSVATVANDLIVAREAGRAITRDLSCAKRDEQGAYATLLSARADNYDDATLGKLAREWFKAQRHTIHLQQAQAERDHAMLRTAEKLHKLLFARG